MAEPRVEPTPQKKKGFFEQMSMFQKILLFIGVVIVLVMSVSLLLGGIQDFYQFFFYIIVLSAVCLGGYVLIKATSIIFAPRYFSPREDLRTKLLNMARDYKPDNVNKLYFVGDKGKKRVLAGTIVGLLGIPYYTGQVKKDKKGHVVYSQVKDFAGKPIPKYTDIKLGDDGDTLFVIKKGFFLFGQTHLIRAHRDFHSSLNGDVEIYDINPYPYGFFEYPYKQIQKDVSQIMIQNQIETILATHEHQHDLISQSVDSAIYFNPAYRMGMKQASEIPEE
jgi:hypothetical protein